MSAKTVRRWDLARSRSVLLTATAASLWCARQGQAQEAPRSADEPDKVEEVVVTGTQIAGSKVTTALPVSVISSEQIATVGAASCDDLLRSIPQMGDVTFNSTTGAVSSNFARGDVGSINLRNLGVGNTLVLLNGRRVVTWPGTQADGNLAPVLTVNSNTLPVGGIERLEVLRDGAAAIYGTDAVAGVVNTVLRDNIDGGDLTLRYGAPEGTHMGEFDARREARRSLPRRGSFTFSRRATRAAPSAWVAATASGRGRGRPPERHATRAPMDRQSTRSR
jgi:outer membrane receptor for ferrienterochelin and colicin